MAEKIDAKWIKGLKFQTSEGRETKDENGKKKIRYFPVERALKPDDVLNWKESGDTVVIVAKDGTKHRVTKTASGKDEKGGAGNAS